MKKLIKPLLIIIGLFTFISTGTFLLYIHYVHSGLEKKALASFKSIKVKAFENPCDNCVFVEKGIGYTYKNNPILNVSIYKDSQLIETYKGVSGRWNTQNIDRNIANVGAPSPNGEYIILPETKGYHDETGGVFIPYEPTFKTQRSLLGFHVDPSWGLDNGEDGTIGCIAFKSIEEYNKFKNSIVNNNIEKLLINY